MQPMRWAVAQALLLLPPIMGQANIYHTVKVKCHTLNFSAVGLHRAASHCCSLPHCGCVSHCARLNSFELASLVSSRAWRKTAVLTAESLWLYLIPLRNALLSLIAHCHEGDRPAEQLRERRRRRAEKNHAIMHIGHFGDWNRSLQAARVIRHNVAYLDRKPHIRRQPVG